MILKTAYFPNSPKLLTKRKSNFWAFLKLKVRGEVRGGVDPQRNYMQKIHKDFSSMNNTPFRKIISVCDQHTWFSSNWSNLDGVMFKIYYGSEIYDSAPVSNLSCSEVSQLILASTRAYSCYWRHGCFLMHNLWKKGIFFAYNP